MDKSEFRHVAQGGHGTGCGFGGGAGLDDRGVAFLDDDAAARSLFMPPIIRHHASPWQVGIVYCPAQNRSHVSTMPNRLRPIGHYSVHGRGLLKTH